MPKLCPCVISMETTSEQSSTPVGAAAGDHSQRNWPVPYMASCTPSFHECNSPKARQQVGVGQATSMRARVAALCQTADLEMTSALHRMLFMVDRSPSTASSQSHQQSRASADCPLAAPRIGSPSLMKPAHMSRPDTPLSSDTSVSSTSSFQLALRGHRSLDALGFVTPDAARSRKLSLEECASEASSATQAGQDTACARVLAQDPGTDLWMLKSATSSGGFIGADESSDSARGTSACRQSSTREQIAWTTDPGPWTNTHMLQGLKHEGNLILEHVEDKLQSVHQLVMEQVRCTSSVC